MRLVEKIHQAKAKASFKVYHADFWDNVIATIQDLEEKCALQTQELSEIEQVPLENLAEAFSPQTYFDVSHSLAQPYFEAFDLPVWVFVPLIKYILKELMAQLDPEEYLEIAPQVFVHKSVKVAPNTVLQGPCIIEEGSDIRSACYIRGQVLAGKGCVLGNSSEFKNCILFDKAAVPHYSYVGDSLVGYKAHFGASSLTSNLKLDRQLIYLRYKDKRIPLGLKKLGAIVGDACEIGCQAVLSPATFLGKEAVVYPLTHVQGHHEAESYVKNK